MSDPQFSQEEQDAARRLAHEITGLLDGKDKRIGWLVLAAVAAAFIVDASPVPLRAFKQFAEQAQKYLRALIAHQKETLH